jgi:phthalate 4,5-cis-dihydrodiol dehydrogenase
MILGFNYTDYLYRPHGPDEFRAGAGGGVVFNQVTHQVEVARLLAGARVRSVRAETGGLDPARPAEGHCMAFLAFEDGAAATLAYSGYDFLDSDELHWRVAEGGTDKPPREPGVTRAEAAVRADEAAANLRLAYGGRTLAVEQPHLPHFGVFIVTCEHGDMRLSPDGVLVHGVRGTREITVPRGIGRAGQGDALDVLLAARNGAPVRYDARWGRATVEVLLAIGRSARERREITIPRGA